MFSFFFRHPLFPLLALLLEKCEEATRGEVDTRVVLSSLENDVKAFIQQEKEGNKPLMTNDVEVDGLVSAYTTKWQTLSLFLLDHP